MLYALERKGGEMNLFQMLDRFSFPTITDAIMRAA